MMMGQERAFAPGARMRLSVPHAAQLCLVADGRRRLQSRGRELCAIAPAPGVYRFEARLEGRPWLFTNPFYFRPPAGSRETS